MSAASGGGSRLPVIMLADDAPADLDRVAGELERRYAPDYRIVRQRSAAGALEDLRALRNSGERVALILADAWPGGIGGDEFLARSRDLYPNTRRGLLIDWGDWGEPATAELLHRAMALGHMDYYVLRPWSSPDEYFHRTVSDFLHEWSRLQDRAPREATVVAERWSRRAHELRNLLARNGVPHAFRDAASAEGRRLLEEAGRVGAEGPVVITVDGTSLVDPSNAEVARAYGVSTELDDDREFDVVVVGAGPAGLSAGVYGASEGLRTLVVEGEAIGGQAGSSSRIRNYLGFPRGVSGASLAQQAYQQAWTFGASFLFMCRAVELRTGGGRHVVRMSDGSEARARAVLLATGVAYRRLGVPSLERLTGAGVFYGSSVGEAQGLAGERVFVVGGGNSAGQAATHLARYAERVTVLVREDSLEQTMSRYLIDEIEAATNVEVRLSTEVVDGGGDGRLERLVLRDRDGARETVPAAAVFIMIGASPNTDWLPEAVRRDRWGYILTGDDVPDDALVAGRRPLILETSLPGVFAVGDVRHRSVKRVATAVGEGAVAVSQLHRYLAEVARDGVEAAGRAEAARERAEPGPDTAEDARRRPDPAPSGERPT